MSNIEILIFHVFYEKLEYKKMCNVHVQYRNLNFHVFYEKLEYTLNVVLTVMTECRTSLTVRRWTASQTS